jgi:ferredoxin-NADP reductase
MTAHPGETVIPVSETSSGNAPRQQTENLSDRIAVRLLSILELAQDTKHYELSRIDGCALPHATAGSHIDVHLPNGLTRQYSLILPGAPSPNYAIAVKNDPASRGGSRYMHIELHAEAEIEISWPRNHFPLLESSKPHGSHRRWNRDHADPELD